MQSFLAKHQITQVTHPPYKTKITFERDEISDGQWDSGKCDGAIHGDWENCVRFQGASFEGDSGVIVLCTMLLISCVLFNKCLYFSYYIAGSLLDRLHIMHTYTHIPMCVFFKWISYCPLVFYLCCHQTISKKSLSLYKSPKEHCSYNEVQIPSWQSYCFAF